MIDLDEPLLSQGEAATRLRVKPQTLAAWRNRGQGPMFVKVGRLCFYRLSHIKQWLNNQVVDPSNAA
jgi:hypothetical protein